MFRPSDHRLVVFLPSGAMDEAFRVGVEQGRRFKGLQERQGEGMAWRSAGAQLIKEDLVHIHACSHEIGS